MKDQVDLVVLDADSVVLDHDFPEPVTQRAAGNLHYRGDVFLMIFEGVANQVFHPFERASNGTLFEGTGMGLAICKRIVDRHGGSIHVVSQPNKGTSFVILLPEKDKERRNISTPSPEFTTVQSG